MTDESTTAPIPVVQPPRQLKISCHNCMQQLDVTSFAPFARIQCPVCGTELIVPAWFDTYLLEEQGGCGGMASVYRALDPALDREIAIKVLKPEISDNPERAELFLHEARAAATINHFAVVPIYTCGVYEGRAYIVMQYMGGGSLDQQLRLAHGKLPVLNVVTWIRDIAEGLENAKNHGIIHHDVKPGNILLDSEGKAKISDFGIAQIIRSGKTDSVEESIQDIAKTWLSPHYVSPEKVRTGKEGFEGDIYSLGATFYHLLTGVTPFSDENVEELLRIRLIEQPLAPHLQRTDIDMELSQLVMMMMSRSPSERPPYKTIISSLNRIIKANSAATVPLPVKKIRSKADPSVLEELRSNPNAASSSGHGKIPVASLILLVCLLILGGGGLYYAWSQGFLDCFSGSTPDDAKLHRDQINALDPNPEITSCLASGDLNSALVFADAVAADSSLPPEQRLTALFQYACALHLADAEDPQDGIRRCLSGLERSGITEKDGEKTSLLAGIRLLAGMDVPVPEEEASTDKPTAEIFVAQCILLAKNASSPASADEFAKKLESLEKALDALPAGSWLSAAWKNHIPAWRQAVLRSSGKKEEVEPLFARLIVKDEKREGQPAISANDVPDFGRHLLADISALDDVSDDRAEDELPDFSARSLKDAAEKYQAWSRPIPGEPALLSMNDVRSYLKNVPEELRSKEERRLLLMTQLRSYIAANAAGNAYQTRSFMLSDGTELGSGEILFNEQYPVYRVRREDGQFKNLRLDWNQIPAREMLTILLYYTAYRENAIATTGKIDDEMASRLADAFLRYAVFAQWYGYYDEAAKFAEKALMILPGKRTEKYTEQLLLK